MGLSRVRKILLGASPLLLAALAVTACGDGGEAGLSPSGYLSVTEPRVLFIAWDQLEGELSGTIYHTIPAGGGAVSSLQAAFTAVRDGENLAFSLDEEALGFPRGMHARLDGEKLTIFVPTGGIAVPIELQPGTFEEYNAAVEEMRVRTTATPVQGEDATPLAPPP